MIKADELQATHWPLVVIGGGITGAGIAHLAARNGIQVLLLEQQDFAFGTSSRSSKLVHGGLRYLSQGEVSLTRHSLLAREQLLKAYPHLVRRQRFHFPLQRGVSPARWLLSLGLKAYDLLAGVYDHRWLPRAQLNPNTPLAAEYYGAYSYSDAVTDDVRLVLRELLSASKLGATCINYLPVKQVAATDNGFELTVGQGEDSSLNLHATKVINATGAWADSLSGTTPKVRPQRGSHLFVPQAKLPVEQAYTLVNPDDQRPVFIFPWRGITCIGTTDLDHSTPLASEPYCTLEEMDYLLTLANRFFPQAKLTSNDILATQAGVRPIISKGSGRNPSQESRRHAVWLSPQGVVNVSGGKLTTFADIAADALQQAGLSTRQPWQPQELLLEPELENPEVAPRQLLENLPLIERICREEWVSHLDDLLLRRLRLGMTEAEGGIVLLDDPVRQVICQALGWDAARWSQEIRRYREIIAAAYAVPTRH